MKEIRFRIDDIGASTKHFNQHGKKWLTWHGKKILYIPFANVWFFKRIWPFKKWAVYDELTASEWRDIVNVFKAHHIVPIIAVTASWVEADSSLTPFPEKFPEEASFLKEAFLSGDIIIANHGLTHCVVGKHLPLFFKSNRQFHREFLPSLDEQVHRSHIIRSQEILETFFEKPIEILVPPGNLWSEKTYRALKGTHIKYIMCSTYMADSEKKMDDIVFIPDSEYVYAFHDREFKLYGREWLVDKISRMIYGK